MRAEPARLAVAEERPPQTSAGLNAAFDLVLWSLVCAGITGLLEGSTLQVRDALGYIPWVSTQIGWHAPLAYALYLLAAAIPLALVAWRIPRLWPWCATVPVAMAALGFIFFMVHYKLHVMAQAALAVGVAARLAFFIDGRRQRLRRTALRLLAVCVLFAGVNARAVSINIERMGSAPYSGEVPGARRPNLLLVVLDAVRASSLGVYGYHRPTSPALDRLAAKGVVFERAYVTSSWTLPSHASMFSGRWPYQLNVGWQESLSSDVPLLPEVMQAAGYRTGGFTANLLYTTRSSGLARGFQEYDGFPSSLEQLMLAPAFGQLILQQRRGFQSQRRLSDRKFAAEVVNGFLDWQAKDTSRPFFAFINAYDAHAPYQPPQAWRERFQSGDETRDRYDASIAAQDSVLGAMFDSLDIQGVLDSTVVVVTADHGELLGEHQLYGHGNSLYAPELHVPLVIRGPGIPAGVRISSPVSLRDLPATLAQLAALDQPFPGASLHSLWTEPEGAAPVSPIFAEVVPPPNVQAGTPLAGGFLRSLISGRYHAIRHSDGRLEVYDLIDDPGETRDLSKEQDMAAIVVNLRQKLDLLPPSP